MRRTLYLILLLILSSGFANSAPGPDRGLPDFQYTGKRHSPETVGWVRDILQSQFPVSVRQAETLLELRLDPERLDLILADIPADKRKVTPRMGVHGIEHPILVAYLEPVLRGDFPDSDALRMTLTHEVIHALVRQNIDHADYTRLPEWFQEGIPNFLMGQALDKMLTKAAIGYENPYAVLGGFEGDHFAIPEVTGGFFFAELEARVGRPGLISFIHGVLAGASLERGFEAVSLLDAEMSAIERKEALATVWAGARQRASDALEDHTQAVAGPFFECKRLYDGGKRDKGAAATACFKELIAVHPGSYAAEVSRYWLAKSHYRRGEPDLALEELEAFDACRLNYGLLDNSRYLRILLYEQLGFRPELIESCRQYLELFPDGADFAKVRKITAE